MESISQFGLDNLPELGTLIRELPIRAYVFNRVWNKVSDVSALKELCLHSILCSSHNECLVMNESSARY